MPNTKTKHMNEKYIIKQLNTLPVPNSPVHTNMAYAFSDEGGLKFDTYNEAEEAVENQLEIDRENGYSVVGKPCVGFRAYLIVKTSDNENTADVLLTIFPLATEEIAEPIFEASEYKDVERIYLYDEDDADFDRQVKEDEKKNNRIHKVTLTEFELETISEIFHEYKDAYRTTPEYLFKVMAIEKQLTDQTNGVYQADTTYDWKY